MSLKSIIKTLGSIAGIIFVGAVFWFSADLEYKPGDAWEALKALGGILERNP